jgi:peptidyl-prolyl cis-trans isomerase C
MPMLQGYLELKLAWALFQKAPDALSEPERGQVLRVARKQDHIEQRILGSREAAQVVVPAGTLNNRLSEVRQRYASADAFALDLERSGLDENSLGEAIERDLRVESVLEMIAAEVPSANRVDAEIFYRLNPDSFDRPEARRLRHILITYDKPRQKQQAIELLEQLRSTRPNAEKFGRLALKHSQCPTAMDGGQLGNVKRSQLYPELEPAAFALACDEISAVLESPIGLHIIRCDEILPHGILPFGQVCDRIIERLTDKRRLEAQRLWIKQLPLTG